MKDVRIDNILQRVFVLKETEDSLVYIPVKSLFKYDYDVLCKMERDGGELLKVMSRTTLDNGRNALIQYDNIIQVMRYTDKGKRVGTRVKKPAEVPSIERYRGDDQPKQDGSLSDVMSALAAAIVDARQPQAPEQPDKSVEPPAPVVDPAADTKASEPAKDKPKKPGPRKREVPPNLPVS